MSAANPTAAAGTIERPPTPAASGARGGTPSASAADRPSAAALNLTPQMLNHYARITHDVAATADFYSRVLGLPIASSIFDDRVPSTGDAFPYFHLFFRMADGSTMAFFECAELPPAPKSSHPAYDVFDHFAFQARDLDELARWRDWLASQGVDVLGPVDHKGICQSIYFHDPNGYRLEFTVPTDPHWNDHPQQAADDLRRWVETKRAALAEGRDVTAAMVAMIREVKQQRYAGGGAG